LTPLEDLLQQCTVKITAPGGWGTGFFVTPRLILTCAHVVRKAADLQVTVSYPVWQQPLSAIVKAKADDGKTLDLALVELSEPLPDHPCVLLDEEPVDVGQALYSYGYLESYTNAAPVRPVNEGLTGDTPPLLKLQGAQIEKGISGAALLNLKTGKVCGMVKETRAAGFDLGGGAIPTRVILEQFPELRSLQQSFHGGVGAACPSDNSRWINPITPPGIDFQPYREAVIDHYSQQCHLYTPTDALLPLEARSVERQAQDEGQKQQPEKMGEPFPVLDGLRKYALGTKREHVLLAGRPGSGKSTTLRQLAVSLAQEGQVPVLVQLKGDLSVPDLIQAEFRRMRQRVTSEQVDEWLFDNRLVLLLDGANEIPNNELRQKLGQFRGNNLTVPMIFTSRVLSLDGELGIDKRLEMKPLSPNQMREFVGKYLPEQGDHLLEQLRDRLLELAETPLLLKLLCDVFDPETNQIPQNRGELFQWFDRDYRRIKKEIEYVPVSENFWEFKSEILQYLAFSMIQGEMQAADLQKTPEPWLTIPKSRAEGILETWLHKREVLDAPTKAKLWLKDLCNHHLLQDAAKPDEIEFHHQLFQEYYAAEHLLTQLRQHPEWLEKEDGQDYTHFQKKYLNYLKWTESIALMLGLMSDEAIAQAMRVVKLAIDKVDLMLGARLAGSVKACSQPRTIDLLLQLPLLPKLQVISLAETASDASIPALLEFLENQVLETRISAIYALSELGSNATIPGFLKALKDKRLDVSDVAADALGSLDPSISIPLSRQLLEDEDPDLRKIAAEILGMYKHLDSQPQLLEKLKDPDLGVRHSAAIALGKMGCKASIPHLLEILDPPYSYLSWSAAELLGELGNEAALPNLINALKNPDAYTRRWAAQSLRKYNSEFAVFGLLDALEDEEISVQMFASESLKKINKEVSIPVLFNLIDNENSKVRKRAIETLEVIGDEIAIPKLIKALEDEDFAVRRTAANALVKSEYKSPVPDLIELLKHQNPLVRSEAAFVLGKMGCDIATQELVQVLLDENQDLFVWINTVIALSRLGNMTAIILLLQLVDLELPSFFRAGIVEALGELKEKISDPELLSHLNKIATPDLLLALKDESSYVRINSALSLGKIGNIDTALELIKALADEEVYVRKVVADSLGEIGYEAAIPSLLELFEAEEGLEEETVRASAANALEKIGGEKTIQGLLRVLENNENWCIRRDAINILGKIGCETTIPRLLNIFNNEDILGDGAWEIYQSAIDALAKFSTPDYLAVLWNIYFQNPEIDLTRAIHAIQNRCQFYNYEIWQAHLTAQKADHQAKPNSDPNVITIQTLERLNIMTDKAPIFNQQHATIGVNYAAEDSRVEFTQHTSSSEQNFEILLSDYQQFIQQLQQKYPTLADATAIPQIIEIEAKLKETQDRQWWQNFLNLKRLWHGSKKAGFKIGEHFAENNVWAIGAIAFLEGVSEDKK
jgi:HEAT repeat protein/energy-coupling factor transporter ATP-binding protein EcfA2